MSLDNGLMFQLPIEKKAPVVSYLSSTAERFVPSWCDRARPTASTPTMHSLASDSSTAAEHLDHGLPSRDPANFDLKFEPMGLIKPAKHTPSPSAWEGESGKRDAIVRIRNTFIDVDSGEDEGLQALEMHRGGAQTWAVSMLGLSNRCQPQQPSEVANHQGCRTPSSSGSTEGRSEDMESPLSFAAPYGSLSMACVQELQKCRQHAAESTQTDSLPVAAQKPSPTMVLLQVPLQIGCELGTPFFDGSVETSVTVLNQEHDRVTGSVSLQLQVLLRPLDRSTGAPLQTPLPPQLLQAPKADAAPQQRKHPSPGAAAKERREMICCHWKRGWCKLGESCKFKHPAEMQGIDAPASLVADCGIDATAVAVDPVKTRTVAGPTPSIKWGIGQVVRGKR